MPNSGDGNQETANSSTEASVASGWAIAVMGVLAAIAVIWLVMANLDRKVASLPVESLPEGIGIFALFYVAAQAIERLLEGLALPFDSIRLWASSKRVPALGTGTPKPAAVANLTTARVDLAAAATTADKQEAAANVSEAKTAVDKATKDRTAVFWGLAFLLGVAFALMFELRFLRAVGVADGSGAERWDVLITGLVVGGGTQFLHGLIGKVKTSDTEASGGTTSS